MQSPKRLTTFDSIMNDSNGDKLSLFQIVILVLSLYVLFTLAISSFAQLSSEVEKLLNYIDFGICVLFLIDFIIRFYNAENKLKFMKWGWIDLISSIPAVDYLRVGRVIRILRLFRLLRAFRSTKILLEYLFRNKAKGVFTSAAIVGILMLIFSSLAILQVENTESGNIKTAEDALWWAYVTITTVGYGDKYPVTFEGRIIAAALMTVGVGLFGTFAGFVSSWLVKDKDKE